MASNPKETLELLTEVHFPNSIRDSEYAEESQSSHDVNTVIDVTLFTAEKVESFKSPGSDGIFPALLQKALSFVSGILVKMSKYSLMKSYIPIVWRKSNIVFIPKVGKKQNDHPKSLRPITLSSFLLKTMEKIMDRDIRENQLKRMPLHPRQFAYQEGKSTTKAIKSTKKK